MKLELSDDQLKSLVSEALLKSLDEKKRETLIAGAIAELLKPVASGTWSSQSNLQRIFSDAVYAVAKKQIEDEMTTNSELASKIKDLMLEALTLVTSIRREDTITKMADAFTKGIFGDRY